VEISLKRNKHPKKEIENAIQFAESQNWRVQVGGSQEKNLKS
jgi:hypothetical protein